MKEISREFAVKNRLREIGRMSNNDMSQVILVMERLKESKKIKYYCMETIVFDKINQQANIHVSFWTDE